MEVVFIKVGSVHGRITVTFVCERSSDLSSATIGSGFEIDASNFNIQIYFQYVTGLFAFICDTSLLKNPLQTWSILLQTEALLLVLNGNSDGAVDKYFFRHCLDPFFPGYHLRYQMTFPALSFFFSFSPRHWERCKGALPAAGNQFIQSCVACRERWNRAGPI